MVGIVVKYLAMMMAKKKSLETLNGKKTSTLGK